jgi:hypothetical protein
VCREDLKSNGLFSGISLRIPHLEKSGTVETWKESPRTARFAGEGMNQVSGSALSHRITAAKFIL